MQKTLNLVTWRLRQKTKTPAPQFFLMTWMADFFRIKFPMRREKNQLYLKNVKDFRLFGCQFYSDFSANITENKLL